MIPDEWRRILREIEEGLGGRVEFCLGEPPLETEFSRACPTIQWHFVGSASGEGLYAAFADGALTDGEFRLLRLALRALPAIGTDPPHWEAKVQETLHSAVEPYPVAVRIDDDLEEIGVPWAWPVFLVVASPRLSLLGEAAAEVRRMFDSLADGLDEKPHVVVDNHVIVGVFPLPAGDPDGLESTPEETAKALVDGLMSESFLDVRAVFSSSLKSFPELLLTLRRLLFLAQAAQSFQPEERVLSVRGIGIYELLYTLRPIVRQAYAKHVLPPVTLSALGAELEQTVMTFVQCDLNVSEAARQLYLHRNSLIYRIERIRELTGFDIRRFDHAATVWSALLMRRL